MRVSIILYREEDVVKVGKVLEAVVRSSPFVCRTDWVGCEE